MTAKQPFMGRIVLVEDDNDIQSMLNMLLQRNGYHVTSFFFGEDALVYFSQAQAMADVILLDLRLPDMGGDDVFLALQNNPHTSRIPVILITAEPSGHRVAQQLGVAGFLAKPFTPAALLQLTESICSPV
jgi:CheY-like chemotaxis protein